jgi:Ca2+-binding RTX toxin-like protein
MRFLPVGLTAAVLLLLCLPAASWAAAASPPRPSCAAGPARSGGEIVGTPCADRIVVPASVEYVDAGAGDDTIVGANSGPVAAVTGSCESETGCHLEVGSQTFEGGPGNDVVYGDRGNDTLRGNGDNDRLYGGIGDDVLEGGPGNDLLSGGFGAEKKIDGGEGDDYVRGDATIDHIFDSGGGFDTLSFSTGVTPGFSAEKNPTGAANFPDEKGERGIWLKLGEGGSNAIDGEPSLGGGNDEVQPGVFERVIGTPFSDYIVGSSSNEQIYGGGGADVIKGEGGNDLLNGGADGDYLDGGTGDNTIEAGSGDNCFNPTVDKCGSAAAVKLREASEISVGKTTGATGLTQVYVVGGESSDGITATFSGSAVTVSIAAGSFNADLGGCTLSNPTTASCSLTTPLDSVLLAGMGGNDTISATNFPDGVGVVAIGGEGEDTLTGGPAEDVLVDGLGNIRDVLAAAAGDDALTHNGGADVLDGGEGSDLFLSVALCKGEAIVGGAERVGAPVPDRDNASWARLDRVGADARIDQGRVGEVGSGGEPQCASGSFDTLSGIEDLEGSGQSDYLVGDGGNNQLLGHKGADSYFGLAGQDSLLANSGTRDLVIDCGADLDSAVIDFANVGDPTPIECESVREGAPEEFNELPPLPRPPTPPAPAPPPLDRKPPRTELRRHPAKVLRAALGKRLSVSFSFAASERGATFRCKLDRRPYGSCRSPRSFRVGLGRHRFKLFAIDAAGNRDLTPAVFSFRIVRSKPAHAQR